MIASFGDNEGNKVGLRGGLEIIGEVSDPPFGFRAADGTKILVTHQLELLKGQEEGSDVVIYAHTHRPRVHRDSHGRLWINPGETSGWTYRKPSIAILDSSTLEVEIVPLNDVVQ
jgi:predicted phosphodiesterase